ncbi:MAG: mandelate racemase [Alphaproteobacteria bacterium]|nr:mandelate racemase [Alphaproteobacteria bacterium]
MKIKEICLYRVKLPLTTPYKVAYRVYEDFDPILTMVRDEDGRVAWGEGHISPGYSHETVETGWAFCREHAKRLVGMEVEIARQRIAALAVDNPVACSSLITAIDMLQQHSSLVVASETRVPLLDPVHAMTLEAIPDEIEALLARGFKTLKVKVGWDVNDDLRRLAAIQDAVAGRAELRLDANRGFSQADGCRFASSLDPEGLQLFEQPCASDDWDANAAVAAVSRVPVMMDESIYGMPDIERAGAIDGIGFVKLKLKKMIGIEELIEALHRIRALGMRPVLGDGTSSELHCWMEACVARTTIDNAGEMNGFLKPKARLFANPLPFENGDIVLPAGYTPEMDMDALQAHTLDVARF